MMDRGRLKAAALALILTTLAACADTPQRISSRPRDGPPPPAAKKPPDARQTIDRAQRYMQAGDYQKAIDAYHAGYQRTPRDTGLVASYTQSMTQMAAAADQALERGAAGDAGKTYATLLKNFLRFEGFEPKLPFSRSDLEAKLETCKKTLFKQGFQAYRQGDLSRSIALWEDLLVLDPQNAEIREALRTARLQQKNLQETE